MIWVGIEIYLHVCYIQFKKKCTNAHIKCKTFVEKKIFGFIILMPRVFFTSCKFLKRYHNTNILT